MSKKEKEKNSKIIPLKIPNVIMTGFSLIGP